MAKDKLNPLRTKHELSVFIDDVEYKFTYTAVNKQIQQTLEKFKEEQKQAYENVDNKRAELKDLYETKSLNEEILKDSSFLERVKILIEQKTLISKISTLEKEIRELGNLQNQLENDLEEYFKRKFELCVVGDGKVSFQKAIDDAGISYAVIDAYINESLRNSVEKK